MKVNDIKALQVKLASPEQIKKWATRNGKLTIVTKPETINYKSLKPEPDGLFCEKIFGPVKDYTCYCGKYKKQRDEGKICEKCGVEIIKSSARRERMSCIELAYPCAHIWMVKELPTPSKISLVLNMSYKDVEQVVYFENYVVLENPWITSKYTGKNSKAKSYEKAFAEFYQSRQIVPLADAKTNEEARKKIIRVLEGISEKLEAQIATLSKSSKNKATVDDLSQDHSMATQLLEALKDINLPFSLHSVFELMEKHAGIKCGIGSKAIQDMLKSFDPIITKERIAAEKELKKNKVKPGTPDFNKLLSRIQLLKWFEDSNVKPSWMILDYIPVTPPDTRPLTQLDNGRFTTSDINDFYRKIIIRNERLKRMQEEIYTPQIILENERRMLQEAVDALLDNAARGKKAASKDKRTLKSLTDHLKGKQGLFRQNLLGKRVDYSGRSVIVVGPNLKMYQAGVPSVMLLELLRPFIIHELIKKYDDDGMEVKPICATPKAAEKLILKQDDTIWPILNKIVKDHPIILNRAPTLHRLGVQAFEPKIIDGKAIRLHPLVTTAFNADFDGDQMGIYVPLSPEAVAEARSILLASWHILGPKDGKPIITPTQDMILGAYYISQEEKGQLGEGIIFANPDEVRRFYETKKVALHAIIGISTNAYPEKGLPSNAVLITTVGKVLFNEILPKTMPFINDGSSINKISLDRIVTSGNDPRKAIKDVKIAEAFGKKTLQKIVDALYTRYDSDVAITAKTMDAIKDIGFEYSTKSSVTISAFDLPPYDGDKQALFDEADAKVARLKKQFEKGLLTDDERYVRVIKLWTGVKDEVTKGIRNMLADEANQTNPVIIMAKSGARGNESNFTQLLGMRGLMSRSWNYDQKKKTVARDTIETPIKHSFLEGLTILEYFNASYGARKGMADTAMKTSKSGYMTRKLVDAAQEIIVTEDDCGTTKGETVSAIVDTKHNQVIESLADRIKNRFAFEDIINPKKDEIIVRKNEIITPKIAEKIEDLGIKEVVVRSAIHCKCKNGICQKCFGNDLTTNKPVAIGTAIGVIAAQSIGEPGTQLNMRTFHTGGAAGEGNMAAGFERLKQLFELTPPKDYEVAIIATNAGTVTKIENTEDGKIVYVKPDYVGEVKQYLIPLSKAMRVEVKDHLEPGDKITEGSINLKELLKIAGITAVRDYLLKEVQRVYRAQGIEISDKYIEIIIRQMTNKLKIRNPGQSKYFIGQITDINEFEEECNELIEQGKVLPTAVNEIYGLENIAITKTGPFLAAASFQDTKKILTDVAIRGDIDNLSGLKENVMIGNKLPAGTGLENSEDVIKLGNEMYKKEY